MSLRWRIALALAAVGLLATIAVGAVSYRSTQQRLVDEVDRSITQAALLLPGPLGDSRIPRRAFADVFSVRVVGPGGDVIGSSFEIDVPIDEDAVGDVAGLPGAVIRDSVTSSDGSERFRIHTIGGERAVVQVARSLEEVDAVLADLRRRTILLVALASVAAAALGWLIAGRVAAPLRRLASSADEVRTTGRLDVDVPVAPAPPGVESRERDEVTRLGRAFRSMLDALARSRADQERLVQDAGHELRTPLTSLRTNLAVLRRHREMDPEMRTQILDDLDEEVVALSDLVDELVTAASGQLTDRPPERLDLAEVAGEVAARVGRRREREVNVSSSSGAGPTVLVTRQGLERSIANLVENACKFDPTGAPIAVEIDAGSADAGGAPVARLRVLDRGPGIPEADLGAVFDRFHRSEVTRSMPGSGLGLSIVRSVVEAHGGSVVAANRDGGGALVGFDLPLPPPVTS